MRRMLRRTTAVGFLFALLAMLGCSKTTTTTTTSAASAAADLDLVPADAVGFAHVNLADLWKSDMFAAVRETVDKAGPKALAAMEEQLMPPPSAFDRLTAFVLMSDRGPLPFGLISFNRPIDPDAIARHYLPEAAKTAIGEKSIYTSRGIPVALYFPSNRQVMLSSKEGFEHYFSSPVAKEGPMKPSLELAANRPVVVSANIAALPIPPQAFRDVPPDLLPLLKAQSVTFSMEVAGDPEVFLVANYKDAAAVSNAEKSLDALKAMGKEFTAKSKADLEARLFDPKRKTPRLADEYPDVVMSVMGIGSINMLNEWIDNPGIRKEGTSLTWRHSVPRQFAAIGGAYTAVMIGLLLPAVQKVRGAAARAQDMNNLKQLAVAMHIHASASTDANTLPATAICDKAGKPLLSWRVKVLPYIEQAALYDRFKLDEPWDSEHNKKLIPLMPKVYTSARVPTQPGYTHSRMFSGPDTFCDVNRGGKLTPADGASNTILIIEGGDAVPWTKPEEIVYDPKKPLPKLEIPGTDGIALIAMGDGSVRVLNLRSITEATLRAAITANGNDVLGADW